MTLEIDRISVATGKCPPRLLALCRTPGAPEGPLTRAEGGRRVQMGGLDLAPLPRCHVLLHQLLQLARLFVRVLAVAALVDVFEELSALRFVAEVV
jgi:hypothetical protein